MSTTLHDPVPLETREALKVIIQQTLEESKMIHRRLSKIWKSYSNTMKLPPDVRYHTEELQHHLREIEASIENWQTYVEPKG